MISAGVSRLGWGGGGACRERFRTVLVMYFFFSYLFLFLFIFSSLFFNHLYSYLLFSSLFPFLSSFSPSLFSIIFIILSFLPLPLPLNLSLSFFYTLSPSPIHSLLLSHSLFSNETPFSFFALHLFPYFRNANVCCTSVHRDRSHPGVRNSTPSHNVNKRGFMTSQRIIKKPHAEQNVLRWKRL